MSRVSLGRAVPAPPGEALKGRDRQATPAAAARRFIQQTKVQRPGAAAAPRLDSLPVRPLQAWAWRFFCLKEASHHTVRVASHARGHAWHSFYYLVFSILFFQCACQADLTRGMRKYDFVDSGGKKKLFSAKPGLSEFRAVSAQKRTPWSPVQGLMPKKINAKKENFKLHV